MKIFLSITLNVPSRQSLFPTVCFFVFVFQLGPSVNRKHQTPEELQYSWVIFLFSFCLIFKYYVLCSDSKSNLYKIYEQKSKSQSYLVGWLSRLDCYPVHLKVEGSVPGQGTLQVRSLVGACSGVNQSMFLSHIDVSLSLFLSLPLSLTSIDISSGKDKKKKKVLIPLPRINNSYNFETFQLFPITVDIQYFISFRYASISGQTFM